MGKPNVVTKRYVQDNARFADVCNFYLFDGRLIIKPEDLVERDITYLIIGIENQTDTHYAMVVRNMLYDALNYTSQVENSATLTIYWNTGSWDGARSLHEMFKVNDKNILEYVPDYKLNLIVPEEIKDFDKFQTEIGALFEFMNSASDGAKLENALKEKGERWENLSNEAIELLNICLDAKLATDSKEGVGNMCKGIEELAAMREARGEKMGALNMLLRLVHDGIVELSIGVERSGISEEEFKTKLKQLA